MKLVLQMIRYKLDLYNEFMIKRFYAKAIWNFYCAYNLALAFLKIELNEEEIDERNKLYKRILLNQMNIDEGDFQKIIGLIQGDSTLIIEAVSQIEVLSEKMASSFVDYGDHPDYVGILAFEIEDSL